MNKMTDILKEADKIHRVWMVELPQSVAKQGFRAVSSLQHTLGKWTQLSVQCRQGLELHIRTSVKVLI